MKNKAKSEPKAPEAMDPSISENRTPVPSANAQRVCWAIKTLREEVWALFPETPVEYSNYDGRNTALDVTFDLSVLDAGDMYDFTTLIRLIDGDPRVSSVVVDSDTLSALVSMHASARTKDRRESFGLAEALSVLDDDEESEGFYEGLSAAGKGLDGGDAGSTSPRRVEGGDATAQSHDTMDGGGA